MKPYSSSASDFATEPQYTDSIAIRSYLLSSADPTSLMSIIRNQQFIVRRLDVTLCEEVDGAV